MFASSSAAVADRTDAVGKAGRPGRPARAQDRNRPALANYQPLDMLKEAELLIGFTNAFRTVTDHENLSRAALQERLLLCLNGIGTNTGLKRMAAGQDDVTYRDLLYVRRRFITRESMREAIAQVVNATLRARHPGIWGEGRRHAPPIRSSSAPGIRT